MIKTCKLCLQPANKLVKSHIIPKAFYEEFRKISLLGVSAHTYDKTYQNGIYGEFLCENANKNLISTMSLQLASLNKESVKNHCTKKVM